MRTGEIVSDRFRILERAGAGGMGVVYRAEDLRDRTEVALKVLFPEQHPERFMREATVLAELSHPAVVRYVAHGVTANGEVYLAMEWLEGDSLSRLIAQRRLRYAECLALLRRICAGLSEAHLKGVIHRDLKPANILLPTESVGSAKIIDFGIARRRLDPRITERGLLVGTISYMSPEQARGISDLSPASDVFSIGSVIYKVLTGQPPFGGGEPTAILAKVLLDDPTPLGELVDGVPGAFDSLVSRMLAKSPAERLPDAAAVLELVERLGADVEEEPARPGLTLREQRVVWVVLLGGTAPEDTETRASRASLAELDPDLQLTASIVGSGGRYDTLADGTRVASFVGRGIPKDEALRAVLAARTMHALFPDRPVAIASGLGVVGSRAPLGDAIDRGALLLARARSDAIHVDDATASLLAGHVVLEAVGEAHVIRGLAHDTDSTRRLLGKPTSCVGRDRELMTLEALLDECVEDRVARAAVVVAPAGAGKSRLRYELLNRARKQHPSLRVLFGRADSVSAGSPFGLLRDALRRAAGIDDGESTETNRSRLAAHVARATPTASEATRTRTAVFLAELAGVPFPAGAHPQLESTRQNPTLLGDAMRGAWLDFLGQECAAHPVLLILEDLHWGDIPTVSFVDAALAALSDAPLLVLALARPEVDDVFPKLWSRREPLQLRLGPLRRSAAMSLAREVLSDTVPDATLERLVELSEGNAFFLEELIRAVAEGRDDLPETVMSMMQARLDGLGSEARRALRAASVFGARFWRGGVGALLGDAVDEEQVKGVLEDLVARELVSHRSSSLQADHDELAFRHAVLQETVYATLTPEDRRLGHGLAAEWLGRFEGVDPAAMAEHLERAEQPERAARWYLAAAERALEGIDLAQVVERSQRALACNPDDESRGNLHYLAADAHYWRGEYAESERHARAALQLIPPGEPRWFLTIGVFSSSAGSIGKDQDTLAWAARAAAEQATTDEARAAQVVSLVRASHGHLKQGLTQAADDLIERAGEVAKQLDRLGPLAEAWVHHGRSARAYYAGRVGEFIREVAAAIEAFDVARDWRTAANARANFGYALLSVGDMQRAETCLREALALTDRLGIAGIGHYVMHNLGLVLAYLGKLDEGEAMERHALAEAELHDEKLLVGASHLYLALILLEAGRPAEAEQEARHARERGASVPTVVAQALAIESLAVGAQGRVTEALALATDAHARFGEAESSDETEGRVRWAYASALAASDRTDEARAEARVAVERLHAAAERLGDAHLGRCFLENVPEHAALVALAHSSDA